MKYRFEGIGKFSALSLFAVLAANPTTLWITQGIVGKISYLILKNIFMWFASRGLIIANIGIERVDEVIDKGRFDDSLSDEVFSKIQSGVTPEEGKAIDQKVRDAFDQFITFGKL